MKPVAFSALDLASVKQGQTIPQTFHHSLELAQHVEALGYSRFWMAEHHNLAGIGSSATAVLLGFIAGGTSTIRVGSGGIMLPNHAPLLIAEQFGTLASLYPGRIDLGVGRAPGTDRLTMQALRRPAESSVDEFPNSILELQGYFDDAVPHQRIVAIPGAGLHVPIWILGSSLYSAQLAAALGLPYAFAGHFAPDDMIEAVELYQARFKPSHVLKTPYLMVGAQAMVAESGAQARLLSSSLYVRFLGMIRNRRDLIQPPVENMEALWSNAERELIESKLRFSIIGGPEEAAQKIELLLRQTNADEIIFSCDPYSSDARAKSYSLISEIMTKRNYDLKSA